MIKDFSKYFIVGTNSDALHDTMNGIVVGELIRCRDCKYRITANCERFGIKRYTQSDSFCSWAERKEKET